MKWYSLWFWIAWHSSIEVYTKLDAVCEWYIDTNIHTDGIGICEWNKSHSVQLVTCNYLPNVRSDVPNRIVLCVHNRRYFLTRFHLDTSLFFWIFVILCDCCRHYLLAFMVFPIFFLLLLLLLLFKTKNKKKNNPNHAHNRIQLNGNRHCFHLELPACLFHTCGAWMERFRVYM